MSIVVERLSDEHIPAVQSFNRRITAGGIPYRFPESSVPQWLPRRDSVPLYQEHFVAVEGDAVRGAYILKHQPFVCNGEVEMVADYQLPISEGTVNTNYSLVGLLMLKNALLREPLLLALGIGGYEEVLTQMLKALKWSMVSCPFFFKVVHPFNFFREIVVLRKKRLMRIVLDLVAFSGVGWVLTKSVQSLRQLGNRGGSEVRTEEVDGFSCWVDDIWKQANGHYSFIAVRDADILNALYPVTDPRFRRLRVLRGDHPIGWAVVLNGKMENNKYFGRMKVGTVVDCLAIDGEERHVTEMATRFLERLRVDIVVTNQLHRSWCRAFSRNGYFAGPSNYIFAVSPRLAQKLHPFDLAVSKAHITRGDGDGPGHLLT